MPCDHQMRLDKEKESDKLSEEDDEKEESSPLSSPIYPDETDYKTQESNHLERLTLQDDHGGFDEALEYAGSWGLWQKGVFVLAYSTQIFCSMHAVSAVFLGATPEHWCHVPGLDPDPPLQPDMVRNLTIPWTSEDGYSKCEYYDIEDLNQTMTENWENHQLLSSDRSSHNKLQCSSWVFDDSDFQSTLVSEFSLVCGRRWLKASVQATFMCGLLFGSLFMGQLSDKFGRRTMTLFCLFSSIVIGTVASFVNSFLFFLLLRFVLAFVIAGLMVVCFVLVMEIVKADARTFTGMMYAFFFGMGIAILPGIAYFVRDWRYLQLTISLSNGILFVHYWLLPESPRWLASQGKIKEALAIFKNAAKINGKELPPDYTMMNLISDSYDKEKPVEENTEKSGHWFSGVVEMGRSQLALVRTPIMRRRCLISFFIWFVAASAYYGLIFSGGNIKANIFFMIFVSGMVEIPSSLMAIVVMKRMGRRLTMCGLFLSCGACCLLILVVPKEMAYVNFFLVSLGKFFDTAVFQQCYLYTSELVPTTVRNIAVGTCSMFARIGCVITPFVIELLGELHYALPSTLFGILSVVAGLFALLLPETKNTKLPETISEVEQMEK